MSTAGFRTPIACSRERALIRSVDKTPVTKALVYGIGAASLYVTLVHGKPSTFMLDKSTFFNVGQAWKVLVHDFVFTSNGETLFGLLLIYHLRVFERLFGSGKYASFLTITTLASSVMRTGLMFALKQPLRFMPGPYGMMYAGLYLYFNQIPRTKESKFVGLPVSEKSFVYLIAAQLAFFTFPTSLVPVACGLVSGALYSSNFLGLKQWRWPGAVRSLFHRYVSPLLQSNGPRVSRNPNGRGNRAGQQQAPQAQPAPQTVQPSEEHIEALTALGFEREAVVTALLAANNDVQRASNILLDGH